MHRPMLRALKRLTQVCFAGVPMSSDASPDVEGIETVSELAQGPSFRSDASPDVEGIETGACHLQELGPM